MTKYTGHGKGDLPDKCPKCRTGELHHEGFELEGFYYNVYCQNEECGARFWESPESKNEWGEQP